MSNPHRCTRGKQLNHVSPLHRSITLLHIPSPEGEMAIYQPPSGRRRNASMATPPHIPPFHITPVGRQDGHPVCQLGPPGTECLHCRCHGRGRCATLSHGFSCRFCCRCCRCYRRGALSSDARTAALGCVVALSPARDATSQCLASAHRKGFPRAHPQHAAVCEH
jgi:hypothetical protein